MDDRRPTIVARGSLSPSTISLSSPDVSSTTFTLSLELCLRDWSGPITVLPDASFLSSRAQNRYDSAYGIYDTETGSKCNAAIMTSCRIAGSGIIKFENPEEELLELGSLKTGGSDTDKAPTDADDPQHYLHQQSNEQQPLSLKVDIGDYKEPSSPIDTIRNPNEQASADEAAENEKDGTGNSQAQPKQQSSESMYICATKLSDLMPGRQYEVRLDQTPGRGPNYFSWWSPGAKADIIANSHKRGRNGLAGPFTSSDTGKQIYAVRRFEPWEFNIMAEMVECPTLTVTA